ncbi:hypothetical protein NC652_009692 [Populus alba x Populus x berolinensis]|uniref:Uncharacterized protein n=1 Tax=Populus alba x Populus x berolinensis TaxID=444605 RepID=A0AAD6RA43_9ROSI|nr:hypothetical protein NC652_009692 [Populus alba x Populus x berolinensis]KAJ7004968.1 hypothetical protein NC653_009709 [Populus alba x Populus x berolinensis]
MLTKRAWVQKRVTFPHVNMVSRRFEWSTEIKMGV